VNSDFQKTISDAMSSPIDCHFLRGEYMDHFIVRVKNLTKKTSFRKIIFTTNIFV